MKDRRATALVVSCAISATCWAQVDSFGSDTKTSGTYNLADVLSAAADDVVKIEEILAEVNADVADALSANLPDRDLVDDLQSRVELLRTVQQSATDHYTKLATLAPEEESEAYELSEEIKRAVEFAEAILEAESVDDLLTKTENSSEDEPTAVQDKNGSGKSDGNGIEGPYIFAGATQKTPIGEKIIQAVGDIMSDAMGGPFARDEVERDATPN